MPTHYGKFVEEIVRALPVPSAANSEVLKASLGIAAYLALHGESMRAQDEMRETGRSLRLKTYWSESSLSLEYEGREVTFRLGSDYSIGVGGSMGFTRHDYRVKTTTEALERAEFEVERAVKFLCTGAEGSAKRPTDLRNLFGL